MYPEPEKLRATLICSWLLSLNQALESVRALLLPGPDWTRVHLLVPPLHASVTFPVTQWKYPPLRFVSLLRFFPVTRDVL